MSIVNLLVLLLGIFLAFWIGRKQVNISQKQAEISQAQAKTMSNQLTISTIQYRVDHLSANLSKVNDRILFLEDKEQERK